MPGVDSTRAHYYSDDREIGVVTGQGPMAAGTCGTLKPGQGPQDSLYVHRSRPRGRVHRCQPTAAGADDVQPPDRPDPGRFPVHPQSGHQWTALPALRPGNRPERRRWPARLDAEAGEACRDDAGSDRVISAATPAIPGRTTGSRRQSRVPTLAGDLAVATPDRGRPASLAVDARAVRPAGCRLVALRPNRHLVPAAQPTTGRRSRRHRR